MVLHRRSVGSSRQRPRTPFCTLTWRYAMNCYLERDFFCYWKGSMSRCDVLMFSWVSHNACWLTLLYPSFFLEKPPILSKFPPTPMPSSVENCRRHERMRFTHHNRTKAIQVLENKRKLWKRPSNSHPGGTLKRHLFFGGSSPPHPALSHGRPLVLGQFLHGTLWQGIPFLIVGGHSLFVVGRKLSAWNIWRPRCKGCEV